MLAGDSHGYLQFLLLFIVSTDGDKCVEMPPRSTSGPLCVHLVTASDRRRPGRRTASWTRRSTPCRAEMADLQQERAQIMAEAGRPGVRNNSNYILNSFSGCKRALSRFVLFRWLCLGTASDLGEGLGESCHCKFPWE